MKSAIREVLGRLYLRLENYGNTLRARTRRDQFVKTAMIDQTATVGKTARIANNRRDRKFITIGLGTVVWGELMTHLATGEIHVGDWCFVGEGSRIWSAVKVVIGNHVLVSHNVNIHDHRSHSLDWRERRREAQHVLQTMTLSPEDFEIGARPIVIEDDVWIGFNAIVLGGVRIGKGAVIGAGTIVTHDVPAFTIAVGNPMRFIRTICPDQSIAES